MARFYPDEMIKVEKDGTQYGLVTPKHNWLGLRIYLNSFVSECLHMPSHGTDILKLFPNTRIDRFGFADGDTIRMSNNEIKKAAKSAGLPFTKIEPILGALVMTGFLEMDEDKGKKLYYKSPLFEEPVSKINWSELIDKTKEFMAENWPTVAGEYSERFCSDMQIIDPFTGDNIELGKRAKTALDIKTDAYEPFKTHKDSLISTYEEFLLNAEGDYNEEEYETIRQHYQES